MDSPRQEQVQRLAEQLRRFEQNRRTAGERTPLGIPALDRLLPGGGLARGTLIEWLSAVEGSGAGTLALRAARQICQEPELPGEQSSTGQNSGGLGLVVIDARGEFYPPAAAACGIDLSRLVVVQPANRADRNWALDQALRASGVGAVWCWLGEADNHSLRRWQLAAETGGAAGLLLRPAAARDEPSFADVRLWIEPLPALPDTREVRTRSPPAANSSPRDWRRIRVELLRARGTSGGANLILEVDHETGDVRLAAELAHPTPERRATGS